MDRALSTDAADLVARVGRQWDWTVTLLAGLLMLAWPGRTVVVLAVLFGVQLVWAGVFRFVARLCRRRRGRQSEIILALLGVLSYINGLTRCLRCVHHE